MTSDRWVAKDYYRLQIDSALVAQLDFREDRNGNCRLVSTLAMRLSETADTWRKFVAPVAEYVAQEIWSSNSKTTSKLARPLIATRLTQRRRREAKGSLALLSLESAPWPQNVCRICGTLLTRRRNYCAFCAVAVSKEKLADVARSGRVAAQSVGAQASRANAKRRHDVARRGWLASSQPAWLNNENYLQKIQPRLIGITYSAIALALGVSLPYAADIRAARRRPHPRHWQALAQLVGVLR